MHLQRDLGSARRLSGTGSRELRRCCTQLQSTTTKTPVVKMMKLAFNASSHGLGAFSTVNLPAHPPHREESGKAPWFWVHSRDCFVGHRFLKCIDDEAAKGGSSDVPL